MDGGIDLMSYEPIVALTDTLLKSGYRGETPTITDDAVLGGVLLTLAALLLVLTRLHDGGSTVP